MAKHTSVFKRFAWYSVLSEASAKKMRQIDDNYLGYAYFSRRKPRPARYWPHGSTDSERNSGREETSRVRNYFSTYHACQVVLHDESCAPDWVSRNLSVTSLDVMKVC